MKKTFASIRRTRPATKILGASALMGLVAMSSVSAHAETTYRMSPELAGKGLSVVGQDGIAPDTAPVPVFQAELDYPRRAMDKNQQGWLIVEMDIDAAGVPYNTKVVRSDASPLFNRSSLDALEKFRFSPATLGGKAVAVEGKRYKVIYNLKES